MGESNNGNGRGASSGNTKDEKNIVRIAAVIHVLFTLIDQAWTKATGVVPQQINRHVLNAAITVSLYFDILSNNLPGNTCEFRSSIL